MNAIKKIDSLGRIVIPSDIRNSLGFQPNDAIEMTIDNGQLILQKHQDNCMFCNSTEGLVKYQEYLICKECIKKLYKISL